jgi:hypothetical protein
MGLFTTKRLIAASLAAAAVLSMGCDEDTNPTTPPIINVTKEGYKIVRDDDIKAGGSLTLHADTTYLLEGFVFVESGATLTIQPGTIVKARAGGGLNASALIICRGGKIMAEGTSAKPIIFTAQQDSVGYGEDMNDDTRGLWGGVIVLGKSITQIPGKLGQIEGIDPQDARGSYGNATPVLDDNSGVIKYVSIRYGGTNIGEGNEINGLTMGAVGSGTTIEYVEVYNNSDDGFEFFGGTVNTKHLVAVGCGDDSFDWDEGFRGKGQFWVAIQSADAGDRAVEADGCHENSRGDVQNYSRPTIYNATLIGSGAASNSNGNMAFKLREETGLFFYNSIVTDFYGDQKISSGTLSNVGVINFDDELGNAGNKVTDHLIAGDLKMKSNLFYAFGQNANTPAMLVKFSSVSDAARKTAVTDSVSMYNHFDKTAGVTRTNLLPTAGGAAFTIPLQNASDSFFSAANYAGAFGTSNWLSGWTAYMAQ